MQAPRLDESKVLKCPTCGFDYLHHDCIVTYTRKEDTDAEVQVVNVPDEDRMMDSVTGEPSAQPLASIPIPENPSMRRSGVIISGWCEGCDNRWSFALAQHKGQTLVWVIPNDL